MNQGASTVVRPAPSHREADDRDRPAHTFAAAEHPAPASTASTASIHHHLLFTITLQRSDDAITHHFERVQQHK